MDDLLILTNLKMHSKGITLMQAVSAVLLLAYSRCCIGNPLVIRPASSLRLEEISEPTCTEPQDVGMSNASSPHILQTFPRECIDTANYFFNMPMVAQIAWHWKRVAPGQPPAPGYNFLPLSAAPTGCMITLDVLDDPNAEDQFALTQIAGDFRALFRKCVQGRVYGVAAGFIPVGPRKVLKLSVAPTPEGGIHNLTAGPYDFAVARSSAKRSFDNLLEP